MCHHVGMRTRISLVVTPVFIAMVLINVSPAFADCAASQPLIGSVNSVTTQGTHSVLLLDHYGRYNTSVLPVDRTDIDAYQGLVKAYMQNAQVVPPNLAPLQNGSAAPQGYTSWDDYYTQNYKTISLSSDALAHASYTIGDIVIIGPPGGAACTQYGFIGFFRKDGVIKSAVAYDGGFVSYTYGGETLSLVGGADAKCVNQGQVTACDMPATYSVKGSSVTMNAGDTKQFASSKFAQVALVTSTHSTHPANTWIEDFDPHSLLHVLSFRAPVAATTSITTSTTTTPVTPSNGESFSASPASGPASLLVTFSGQVSNGNSYSLDFGDAQPKGTLRCATFSASSTTCQLPPVTHIYSTPGTFSTTLTDVINPCALVATSSSQSRCTGSIQYRPIGTATISVFAAQPKQAFKVSPRTGSAPLSVDFYGPSDTYTYSIDFGDGSQPFQYSGPNTVTSCKVRVGGLPGCIVASHTYSENGSYIARLSKNGAFAATVSLSVSSNYGSNGDQPTASCPVLLRTLARGSRGEDVSALQQYFVELDILGADSATGFFGARTQAAVSQWQSEHALAPVGIVGSRTRAALANCRQ